LAYTLLVNTTPEERRVALIEGPSLLEFHTERRYDRVLVGNIYKGRVVRVMPGMDAAFVEIGIDRAGFLQMDKASLPKDTVLTVESLSNGSQANRSEGIEVGKDILVQVTRDPMGGKGARLTTALSLAGRNLVFLPTTKILGVSRRIEDKDERDRLKGCVAGLIPDGAGVVLRTAALGRPESELTDDLSFLNSLWERVKSYADDVQSPSLVHEDLDLLLRTARDLLTEGCDGVVVDTEEDYDRLLQFVDSFMPRLNRTVEKYGGDEPLFESFGIEQDISSLLDRTVWLKSGGSIVIDRTEALTAIDVNTGKYTGKGDPEETVRKTNIEAAHEIAAQLRLRNIGGIIVVDFIDMQDAENRRKVYDTLVDDLSHDKAVSDVIPMSPIGLVELTRKRLRDDSFSLMTDQCPYCDGRGWIRSVEQVCGAIIRKLTRDPALLQARGVKIMAHSRVVESLIETFSTSLADIESQSGKHIRLVRRDDLHMENFTIQRD